MPRRVESILIFLERVKRFLIPHATCSYHTQPRCPSRFVLAPVSSFLPVNVNIFFIVSCLLSWVGIVPLFFHLSLHLSFYHTTSSYLPFPKNSSAVLRTTVNCYALSQPLHTYHHASNNAPQAGRGLLYILRCPIGNSSFSCKTDRAVDKPFAQGEQLLLARLRSMQQGRTAQQFLLSIKHQVRGFQ